jgi:hypothetical protein
MEYAGGRTTPRQSVHASHINSKNFMFWENQRTFRMLPASYWFLVRLILRSWKWRLYVPPKRQPIYNGPHGIISKKIELFITTAVGTSNPLQISSFCTHLRLFRLISETTSSSNTLKWYLGVQSSNLGKDIRNEGKSCTESQMLLSKSFSIHHTFLILWFNTTTWLPTTHKQ